MRNGTLTDDNVTQILSRCLDRLCEEEKTLFDDAIHLVPFWNMTDKIIYEYLLKLDTPIVKIRPHLSTIRANGQNHCTKESSFPMKVPLCEGAIVMLLKNFVVEHNIMNGSVGTVRKIVYDEQRGPHSSPQKLPSYVVVEFRNVSIDDQSKAFPDYPPTCIPIPVVTEQCEKKCCSITTIPLRICVALTIHKCQGMTIGVGQTFERAVVYLPDTSTGTNVTPGLELVAMSRVTDPSLLAIGNLSSSLVISNLKKIGTSPTNQKIKAFQLMLAEKASLCQDEIKEKIQALDIRDDKTFDGGCEFLLDWYRTTFPMVE